MALTDADIDTLVREPKSVTLRRPWLLRMKQKGRHLERDFDLRGARGSKFRLIIRQNQLDPADFSIILGLIRSRSRRLFHLRRYKGNSHGHTNKIEREAFPGFPHPCGYHSISEFDRSRRGRLRDFHFTLQRSMRRLSVHARRLRTLDSCRTGASTV